MSEPTHHEAACSVTRGYHPPSADIQALVDAPRPPRSYLSPKRNWLVQLQYPELPDIARVSQPEKRLAGLRFHAETHSRSSFWQGKGLWLLNIENGQRIDIDGLPNPLFVSALSWSPNQAYIAFSQLDTATGTNELWLIDIAARKATRLVENLNTLISQGFTWLPDSQRLLVTLQATTSYENVDAARETIISPTIQDAGKSDQVTSVRTFQDLLKNESDARELEYYLRSQPVLIDVKGQQTSVGEPDLYLDLEPSPDGEYVLTERITRPFSYQVPLVFFPRITEVRRLDDGSLYEIDRQPLQETLPPGFDSVLPGRRAIDWRQDASASLWWVEALDGGNPSVETAERDAVYIQAAPFNVAPRKLATLSTRLRSLQWGNGSLALLEESWWEDRSVKQWRLFPDQPEKAPVLLNERSSEDRYNSPGHPVMVMDEKGSARLWIGADGNTLLMIGAGASPEGDRPFLDRWDIVSGKKERLFHSQAPHFEMPVTPLNDEATSFMLSRESVSEPPNLFVIDLTRETPDRALTDYQHPMPKWKKVTRETIHYQREDGVELNGELYLPPDYDQERDGPLPVLMWAYPREFKSAAAAGQTKGSPYKFTSIGYWGALPHVLNGFAVLEGPSMPIIGADDEEPNDTYIEQLTASARAAIDELARRGVGDPERCAVGGHSYGAFMTANLLAHTSLFKAGIARSGAYNRTLTPFGFQAEERNYWQAPKVYQAMSPFDHADKIKTPLLLIHGADDNNAGTFPMQSERMFSAVKGLGGEARLVMLPYESHAYRARESILHMLYEQEEWLKKYV